MSGSRKLATRCGNSLFPFRSATGAVGSGIDVERDLRRRPLFVHRFA
jgi:hypothetical protein